MAIKKLPTINEGIIKTAGVQALANRPNLAGQYGQGGLSADALKKWFDKLATAIIQNIGQVADTLSGDGAGEYIKVRLSGFTNDDDGTYDVEHLDSLIRSMTDGKFAEEILKVVNPLDTEKAKESLQGVLSHFAGKLVEMQGDTTSAINQAKAEAVGAASADATAKANAAKAEAKEYTDAAKAEAISTASTDATTKANTAKAEAISTASTDATSKASTALGSAKSYTDSKVSNLANTVAANKSAAENAIRANTTNIAANAQSISNLQTSKQDNLSFDGSYNEQTNKVATVATVTNKIAEVVADAPEAFDTLEEIASWIAEHPKSVAELNSKLDANTKNINENRDSIAALTETVESNKTAAENAIATAKAEAISTASDDATAKANTALVDAKKYVDSIILPDGSFVALNLENGEGLDSVVQRYTKEEHHIEGVDRPNTSQGKTNAAFGMSNDANGKRNIVTGMQNTVGEGKGAEHGNQNIVGGHDNDVYSDDSLVVGQENINNSHNSIIAGIDNSISGYNNGVVGINNSVNAEHSFIGGSDNTTATKNADGSTDNTSFIRRSVVAGGSNNVQDIDAAIVGGYENIVHNGGSGVTVGIENRVDCTAGITAGYDNKNWGTYSTVSGEGNVMDGGNKRSAVMFGKKLNQYNNDEARATFGMYNNDVEDAKFIVGIGTSDDDRKNGLEVYTDGTVKVSNKQGGMVEVAGKTDLFSCGTDLTMSFDPNTYKLSVSLLNSYNLSLSTQSIDLPLGTMVVEGNYNNNSKSIVLTMQNGQKANVYVGDLVDRLAPLSDFETLSSDYNAHKAQYANDISAVERNAKEYAYNINQQLRTIVNNGFDARPQYLYLISLSYSTENVFINLLFRTSVDPDIILSDTAERLLGRVYGTTQKYYGFLGGRGQGMSFTPITYCKIWEEWWDNSQQLSVEGILITDATGNSLKIPYDSLVANCTVL